MNFSGRTRIAPTPSGNIHLGNAVNFYLIKLIAKELNLQLFLRIDDFDQDRYRKDYVENIFESLKELEIKNYVGPQNVNDLEKNYSQQRRYADYSEFLRTKINSRFTFVCLCSRKDKESNKLCDCIHQNYDFKKNKTSVKLKADLIQSPDDLILWRKEDIPSYTLVSLFHDIENRITHIVRGEDLEHSSLVQFQLARLMDDKSFVSCRFFHHPLLKDSTGEKLSKSVSGSQKQSWHIKEVRELAMDFLYSDGEGADKTEAHIEAKFKRGGA